MIDIIQLYNAIAGNVNKTQSAFLKPSVFDTMCWQVSFQLFNEKATSAPRNSKIKDDIAPFLKSKNIMVTPYSGSQYGMVKRPKDYIYFSSMRSFFIAETGENCYCPSAESSENNECENKWQENELKTKIIIERNVEEVDDFKWSAMLSHPSRCPTKENPRFSRYDVGFKVAPKDLSIVVMDYYREPVRSHLAYTAVGNYFQFDAAGSTNLEWGVQTINEIIQRFNQLFGLSIREGEVFQAATQLKNTTK